MTEPLHAVTLDDARYYVWPPEPEVHYPSITTILKEGIPKPFITPWATKQAAYTALDGIDTIAALLARAAEVDDANS